MLEYLFQPKKRSDFTIYQLKNGKWGVKLYNHSSYIRAIGLHDTDQLEEIILSYIKQTNEVLQTYEKKHTRQREIEANKPKTIVFRGLKRRRGAGHGYSGGDGFNTIK